MVIVTGSNVSGLIGFDHTRHIEDFRLPVIFPSWNGPEQTLISDSESHFFIFDSLFILIPIFQIIEFIGSFLNS